MIEREDIRQRAAKTAVLYVIYLAVGGLCMLLIRTELEQIEGFWTHSLRAGIDFFYMLIVLFSLLSIFLLNDFPYRERFYAYRDEEGGRGILSFILHSVDIWIDFAALALLMLVIPGGLYFELRMGFLQLVDEGYHFLIYAALVLPIAFLFTLTAHLSTVSWWARPTVRRLEEKREKKIGEWVKQTVFSSLMYVVGAFALVFVVPLIYSLMLVAWMFITTISVVAAIVAAYLIFGKYIIALIYRIRFMKRLKGYCKKQGLTLELSEGIYRSVFSARDGRSFTLQMDGRKYFCKFITPLKQKAPVYFAENGEVTFVASAYVAEHYRTERYFFDEDLKSEGKRILIINPGARWIYATDNFCRRELHSGDVVMGYEVFRTENFLSAVKREYLGK